MSNTTTLPVLGLKVKTRAKQTFIVEGVKSVDEEYTKATGCLAFLRLRRDGEGAEQRQYAQYQRSGFAILLFPI